MKNIFKCFLPAVCAISCLCFTSCADDSVNTDTVAESEATLSSLVWGMPARSISCNNIGDAGDFHYDYGQGTLMHIRDIMCDEFVVNQSSYDWYADFTLDQYQGQEYTNTYLPFYTLYNEVQQCNLVVENAKKDLSLKLNKGYLGAGYAMRAWTYLDIARLYEYLPTDVTTAENADGHNVQGLTAPIVTEETDPMAPVARATHYQMFNFIMQDLDSAENNIGYLTETNKGLPHLNVVYGLKARAYLWHASFLAEGISIPSDTENTAAGSISAKEAFAKAQEYAQLAIDLGVNTPMTEKEWTDPATGFNTYVSSWMLGIKLTKEADAVQSGIINWTSWSSNETTFGYASVGPMVMAASNFYNKISDTDFRKLSWKAPEGSSLSGKESYINQEKFNNLPDYASLKFRPGEGNMTDYKVGAAVAIPLMRIEEMYFIAAEAAIQQDNLDEGKQILSDFMVNYRDPQYKCLASTKEALVSEVIRQKRVEFWGEGLSFFDVKRLNLGIDRTYEGTTFNTNGQFKTECRPAWMNICLCRGEINYNSAINGWNNPDPSNLYTSKGVAQIMRDNTSAAQANGLRVAPKSHLKK